MRNRWTAAIALAVLACTAFSMDVGAQQRGGGEAAPARARVKEGFVFEGVPKMPNPPGPAPKQDLSGAWVGPLSNKPDPVPPMTPTGEKVFKTRKGYSEVSNQKNATGPLGGSNDPFITCDPLGFPRDLLAHAVSNRGGTLFGSAPNRILIGYEQQRIWREIWMDGRKLPDKVDVPGGAESRYYGYSVGHWDNDNTLVIDTTGVDPRVWLDEAGHPLSPNAHIQERYVRADQYNLRLMVTVDDPKYYTKPFTFMNSTFYWMKNQEFAETMCIPSEGLEYRDTLARPSGIDADTSK
jgi:hypothetical protein